MFIGSMAVVVILLIVIGLMSSGSLSGSTNSSYITEAKKVQALMSNLGSEGLYYYTQGNESFSGIDMKYFLRSRFAPELMVPTSNMDKDDWDGWPTIDKGEELDADNDGELDSPYTGPYIKLGGTAGDEMRIIVTPIDNGKHAGLFLLKKKENSIPEDYVNILEKTLANDPAYVGG